MIFGYQFLAAAVILLEGCLRQVEKPMVPIIMMLLVAVIIFAWTKTSEQRDTFGWRMALFVTFIFFQCFLVKINTLLYVFGVGFDFGDMYCSDARNEQEAEWCQNFWFYAALFDTVWKWLLDLYFAHKLHQYAYLKPNNIRPERKNA